MNLASLCVICVQGSHGAAAPEIEKTRRHSRVGGATGVRSSFGRLSADRLRLRYRLSLMACVASRWRLRFRRDRRRRGVGIGRVRASIDLSGRSRRRQLLEPGINHRDLVLELSNRHAHSRLALELEQSALALQLPIFEPAAVSQSNENVDDLLNSRWHGAFCPALAYEWDGDRNRPKEKPARERRAPVWNQ